MSILETLFASGMVGVEIAVPVLRATASILLAFAISKDCKARHNGSSVLWGVLTLISPIFFGILYFIYSRFFTDRNPETSRDKKLNKKSMILCVFSVLVYLVMVVVLVVSIIIAVSSGVAGTLKGDFGINDKYYDMNGIEYDYSEEVPLYDEKGNTYKIAESPNGWNYYTYFDQNGNEYDIEKCYISENGYFYYDAEEKLQDTKELYYYDKHFYDENGNIYAHIDNNAFWDESGNICITYKGTRIRLAFDEKIRIVIIETLQAQK